MAKFKTTNPQQSYIDYQDRFAKLSDDELLELKRAGKKNPGWTSTRGAYEHPRMGA